MNDVRNIPTANNARWNTVGAALAALFPIGSLRDAPGVDLMPFACTDVFAASAYLIERGGVYHRIVPGAGTSVSTPARVFGTASPGLLLTKESVTEWRTLGAKWLSCSHELERVEGERLKRKRRKGGTVPSEIAIARGSLVEVIEEVQKFWRQLVAYHGEPIVARPKRALNWWLPAVALLIISDEASRGLGYQPEGKLAIHPLEKLMRLAWEAPNFTSKIPRAGRYHEVYTKTSSTFAIRASPDVARVVPKGRTPGVGCTMRTLTHNVALVPPTGIVDMNWHRELRPFLEHGEPLNVLAIPFPYHISANCFEPAVISKTDDSRRKPWGWFHVRQRWLDREGNGPGAKSRSLASSRRQLVRMFLELVLKAKYDTGRVHGVILPELALDWATYAAFVNSLCKDSHLRKNGQHVEFLVSGSSTDWRGRPGNYVLTTTFSMNDKGDIAATSHARSKHHRWKIDGGQITDYALGPSLDPNVIWWEGNELPSREVGLTVFRRGAIFSAMICEDLARSEPCHDPLRAVGPNLVFVLLMDGAQLPGRWASRYATALADDPGSSVLTLTSLGLLERTNATGRYPLTRNISIWKDDTGKTVQIGCPPNAHGIVVTMSGEVAMESTLDGRPNEDGQAWRYHGHQPVYLRRSVLEDPKRRWVFVGPEALREAKPRRR